MFLRHGLKEICSKFIIYRLAHQPPRGLRSVTKLPSQRPKSEKLFHWSHDSAVGCSELLGGFLKRKNTDVL